LSFELGIPEEELASRLTNRSFVRYQHHAGRWMLPSRRLQLQIAQAAYWSARAAGAQNIELDDFIFDPPDAGSEGQEAGEEAATFFEFKPRPKKVAEPAEAPDPTPKS
jgi:hypothetical protein